MTKRQQQHCVAACPKIVHTRTVVRRAPHAPSAASAPRSKRAAGTQLPRWLVRNCRRHCSHSNARVARRRDVDARAAVAAEAQRAHRSAKGEAVTTAERPRWQQQSWLTAFAGGGRREQDWRGRRSARQSRSNQNVIAVIGSRLGGRPFRAGLVPQSARASEAGRPSDEGAVERVVGESGLSEGAREG